MAPLLHESALSRALLITCVVIPPILTCCSLVALSSRYVMSGVRRRYNGYQVLNSSSNSASSSSFLQEYQQQQQQERTLRERHSEHPLVDIVDHDNSTRFTQSSAFSPHSKQIQQLLLKYGPIACRIFVTFSIVVVTLVRFGYIPHSNNVHGALLWSILYNVFLALIFSFVLIISTLELWLKHVDSSVTVCTHTIVYVTTLSLCTIHICPYIVTTKSHYANNSTANILGNTQTLLSLILLVILILTPRTHTPVLPNAKIHPQQTSSVLSSLLFTYLDPSMFRYYWNPCEQYPKKKKTYTAWLSKLAHKASVASFHTNTDTTAIRRPSSPSSPSSSSNNSSGEEEHDSYSTDSDVGGAYCISFLSVVPPLPDFLTCEWILSNFRWLGDAQIDDLPILSYTGRITGGPFEFIKTYLIQVLSVFAFTLVAVTLTFVSPLSMNLLLQYLESPNKFHVSPYVFVAGLLLGPLLRSMSLQQSLYLTSQLGLRLRVFFSHAMLGKLLRLKVGGSIMTSLNISQGQGKDHGTAGGAQIDNLIGTDIDTIAAILPFFTQLVAIPIKLLVSIAFLYYLLGWSAFVALLTIVAFLYPSYWVSSHYGAVQERIMQASDRRVNLISEILSSIRTIKTFAWENPMMNRVNEARKRELSAIGDRAKVFAGMMFLSTGIPAFVCLTTFASYTFGQGQTLTASVAFTSLSLFGLLREAVVSTTYLASALIRARVSYNRVTSFLRDGEELDTQPVQRGPDSITISDATLTWREDSPSNAWKLRIEALNIPKGKMTVIAGHIGSGKTALLYAILGEMHLNRGSVYIPKNCQISYAAQEPWLQNTTVRENILFGSEYDRSRYQKVLKQCALVDDLTQLSDGDQTIVGERGLSLSGGQKSRICLARAIYARTEIVLLDDILSAVDAGTVSHLFKYCLNGSLLRGRTVVLVTHQVELCCKASNCSLVLQLHDGQIIAQGHPAKVFQDDSLRDSRRKHQRLNTSLDNIDMNEPEKEKDTEAIDVEAEASPTGNSWNVHKSYLLAMGGFVFWILYGFINLIAHLLMIGQGGWIGYWVNAPDNETHLIFYFTIYALIQIAGGLFLTLMYLYLIAGSIRASGELHKALVQRIFGAPIRWFDKTPIGRIVNRFSKDTEILDTEVIESLQPVFDYGAQVILVAITISAILPVFLLPACAISVLFYFVGRLYIFSALNARKQVAISRSPMFSTVADCSRGAVTIRAFERVQDFLEKFRSQTDVYNRMQLYQYALDRWLEERSDATGAAVAFIVGLLALSGRVSIGTTGFLVSTGLEFTSRILFVVRAFNQNELNVTSVSRIIEYTQIEQEPFMNVTRRDTSSSWPLKGSIQIENLSVRYDEDSPDVLKNLSIRIPEAGKIAVVGRTGCGKSTLALALLKFVHFSKGKIMIDGRDTSYLNLQTLRSRISLIPQDPVLFSGTLRSNLDPFEEHSESELWKALSLSGFIESYGSSITLELPVAKEGSNFSLGQRQILALARCLVRKNKIVIMDEATASVDPETDSNIQRCIRENFQDVTIITIAHRLTTIMDYDKVITLREGQLVEYDSPLNLMDKESGLFKKLCLETEQFDELHTQAKNATERKNDESLP